MPLAPILIQKPCLIPAPCFNRVRLYQRNQEGLLEFALPGLAHNRMQIKTKEWVCWNDRLHIPLLSWHDFQPGNRRDLTEPIPCTLSVHHSYSRTVIFHIYDSLERHFAGGDPSHARGELLRFPAPSDA